MTAPSTALVHLNVETAPGTVQRRSRESAKPCVMDAHHAACLHLNIERCPWPPSRRRDARINGGATSQALSAFCAIALASTLDPRKRCAAQHSLSQSAD